MGNVAEPGLRKGLFGLLPLAGQCFSTGPLIDVAVFLGIVASLAGAVLLAALRMVVAFSA
jgi:hypothetical protein